MARSSRSLTTVCPCRLTAYVVAPTCQTSTTCPEFSPVPNG